MNGPTGKLVILQGERTGAEFHLMSNRMVLGRADAVDIQVPDRAASRQHAEITRGPEGFTVRDLGSGNGTYLNGEKIREAELLDGDKIEIGSHLLSFHLLSGPRRSPHERQISYSVDRHTKVPSGQPPPRAAGGGPAPAPAPRYSQDTLRPPAVAKAAPAERRSTSGLAITLIVLFTLVFLGLAGIIGYQLFKRGGGEEATGPSEGAAQYVQQGNEALAAQEFDEAREHFSQALQLEADNAAAASGMARVDDEEQLVRLLGEAENQIAARNYLQAILNLENVRDNSTVVSEVASNRLRDLYNLVVAEGRAAIDAGDLSQADQLARLVLDNDPDHRSGLALRDEIETARRQAQALASNTDEAADEEESDDEEEEHTSRRRRHDDDEEEERSSRRHRSRDRDDEEEEEERSSAPAPVVAEAEESSSRDDDEEEEEERSSRRRSRDDGDDFSRGWRYYDSARFEDAQEFFNGIAEDGGDNAEEAASNAERIGEFAYVYNDGKGAYEEGDYAVAAALLRRAYSYDGRLNRHYRDELAEMLAESYYHQAQDHYDRGDYKDSGRNANIALNYNSRHSETQRLVRQLEEHANEMYIDAQAYRDSNPARAIQLCRDIEEMLPSGNSVRRRATDLRESLE